jgi:hypothetical protein
MIQIIDAIRALVPNAECTFSDTKIVRWLDSRPQPSQEAINTKIAELTAAEPLRLLRQQRNQLLAQTDWRFRSDLTPSQAWIDYCQALRDLPANSTPALDENGQLTGVNWPTPPEN